MCNGLHGFYCPPNIRLNNSRRMRKGGHEARVGMTQMYHRPVKDFESEFRRETVLKLHHIVKELVRGCGELY